MNQGVFFKENVNILLDIYLNNNKKDYISGRSHLNIESSGEIRTEKLGAEQH